MDIEITQQEETHRVTVRGDATIYGVREAFETFRKALAESRRVEVDLSAVEEIDSAFCQLLVAVWRQGKEDGIPVEVARYGPVAGEVMGSLHLDFLSPKGAVAKGEC
ncbi:MAG: STAS domain-containing protein [Nitrospirae bacterium]|nr:STAS domain-containing protein [Nitrospirota bacterium]